MCILLNSVKNVYLDARFRELNVIYLFIYCNWVITRWQWLFYMYTKHEIGY